MSAVISSFSASVKTCSSALMDANVQEKKKNRVQVKRGVPALCRPTQQQRSGKGVSALSRPTQ